ncbi:MAG TPA: hypothetical protein VHI78_08030, partial [Bacteroidales bacterium]|nr:hypothetical protein [Bacteroidales bacterium]
MKSGHKRSISGKPVLLVILLWPVLISVFGQAETDLITQLKEKFSDYIKSYPREEIFMHTDREEYVAGEEMFFSLYVIDRQSLKTSLNSRIAYIELLNPRNIPVIQQRIIVNDGIGSGNFNMPDSLITGVYVLRAYTSWMKNFLPDNCFQKYIYVYNLLRDDNASIKMPVPGITVGKNPANYSNSGVKFMVDRSDNDSIKLLLDLGPDFNSGIRLYSIIHTRGNISYSGLHYVDKNSAVIQLSKSVLLPGINQITLFNDKGIPVAERFIYSSSTYEPGISLHGDEVYKVRDNIELDLEPNDRKSGRLVLSISVSPGMDRIISLQEYMEVGTEYGMRPDQIIKNKKTETQEEYMDSILSDISSSWINWSYITSGRKPGIRYPAEKDHYYISGTCSPGSQGNNENIPFIILCSPGKNAVFQYSVPDSAGNFRFPVEIDQGLSDLIIMPDRTLNLSEISVESAFSQIKSEKPATNEIQMDMPEYISKWSINYQVRKLYKITEFEQSEKSDTGISQVIRFYGKPDHEIIMSDYISLPLMEEVFFEILPNVAIRKRGAGKEIVIIDRVDNHPFSSIPCLMIDGVIIKDPALIIDMDPELVERIDVIKENYIVGRYVFPGIVNVITKKGDFSLPGNPEGMKRLTYPIAKGSALINGPDTINSGNSRIPDYRNTLYWNPAVITNKDGKSNIVFRSSDN